MSVFAVWALLLFAPDERPAFMVLQYDSYDACAHDRDLWRLVTFTSDCTIQVMTSKEGLAR